MTDCERCHAKGFNPCQCGFGDEEVCDHCDGYIEEGCICVDCEQIEPSNKIAELEQKFDESQHLQIGLEQKVQDQMISIAELKKQLKASADVHRDNMAKIKCMEEDNKALMRQIHGGNE